MNVSEVFFDTNVIFYLLSADRKADRAEELLAKGGIISVRAMLLAQRHRMPIYDALIVAAALLAGCRKLYSEDMQDGQVFAGQLTVRNPFS